MALNKSKLKHFASFLAYTAFGNSSLCAQDKQKYVEERHSANRLRKNSKREQKCYADEICKDR